MVEYSEITPSAARLRNADDSLTYWAANLCIHFFTLDFLRRVCDKHERQGRTGSPFQLHIYPQKWLVVQSFWDCVCTPYGSYETGVQSDTLKEPYRVNSIRIDLPG